MRLGKVLKWSAVGLAITFVAIQALPFGRSHTNPAAHSEPAGTTRGRPSSPPERATTATATAPSGPGTPTLPRSPGSSSTTSTRVVTSWTSRSRRSCARSSRTRPGRSRRKSSNGPPEREKPEDEEIARAPRGRPRRRNATVVLRNRARGRPAHRGGATGAGARTRGDVRPRIRRLHGPVRRPEHR